MPPAGRHLGDLPPHVQARRAALADIEMHLRRASSREEVIRLSIEKTRIELS